MIADQIQVKELFLQALERSLPADRDAFLRNACGDDSALRQQVDCLLKAHASPASLLKHGVIAQTTAPLSEQPGTLIGPYKLLEQIGEGGMGLVYMAEQQQPVRRLVALKLVKPGMDSKQVIARFEAERQALAMMDHPNIAKVHDAGTTETGRPYFVMELVRGIPINEFGDQQRLTVRQRLELFIQVCQAVQHAHQKGIIHRDLKPTNVLVTKADTIPLPKVIDFGIAKALGPALTDHTLHTGFAQLVGTPMYMSPEQAEMNHFGVDTRSDVYSLGVLLYELLTGTTPFDKETLSKAGLDEMRRMIREDEPETVSQRLARTRRVGSAHQTPLNPEPRTLNPYAELDWIVMKSLEKDRSRRYESASALAADIHRYLSDEPVLACPPTTMYRFQKFARKHKPALATAAAIALCLALGTTVSAWQAVRATTAEAQANANAGTAQEKAKEAATERDEAQRQRDEVRALNEKLLSAQQELQRTLYASNMNLAEHSWAAGGAERVRDLLEQHRPKPGQSDLRGFEWFYLHRMCHSEVFTLKGTHIPLRVTYSLDGKRLFTFNGGPLESRELKVWNAHTGHELFTLNGDIVYTVSLDGERIASKSAGQPGEIKVWDGETGRELRAFKGQNAHGYANTLAFSADGKRLAGASGFADAEIKIWNPATGEELLTVKGTGHNVFFSPDGKRLVSAQLQSGEKGQVKMWDSATGQELLAINGGGPEVSAVFSPDSKRLAIIEDRLVKVLNAETGRELLTLKGHTREIIGLSFSPESQRLASASSDKTVKIWDVQTGQNLFTIEGDDWLGFVIYSPDGKRLASRDGRELKVWDALTGQKLHTFVDVGFSYLSSQSVAFSPDGKHLATTYGDRTVKVWDAAATPKPLTIQKASTSGGKIAISPDGKRLACAAEATTAKVWDSQTGEELLTLKGRSGDIKSIAFSPDGKRIATGSNRVNHQDGYAEGPGEVKVWDAQTGQELFTLKGHTQAVHSVAFSPDSKRLVSGSSKRSGTGPRNDGEMKIWDIATGKEILAIPNHTNCVVYSPDGKRLASSGGYGPNSAGEVKVWDAQTGQEIHTLKGHAGGVWSVVYSPDGKRLASAAGGFTGEKAVKMWDAHAGQELFTMKQSVPINCVAFSPDGNRLVTASSDHSATLWDAQTGQQLPSLKGHTDGVGSVAFSPSGQWLASTSADGTIRIWDATPLPEKP